MAEIYVCASRLQLLGGMLMCVCVYVCVCGWGGVGGSRFGRIFPPPETTGLCECVPTWWTYAKPSGCGAVHVRMFSLFLFARLACCLTALAGAPVLAW